MMVDHVSKGESGGKLSPEPGKKPAATDELLQDFGEEMLGIAKKAEELKAKLEEKINEMIEKLHQAQKIEGKDTSSKEVQAALAPFYNALTSAQARLASGVKPELVQKDLMDVTSIGEKGVHLMSSMVHFRGQVQVAVDRVNHGEPLKAEHKKVLNALEQFHEVAKKHVHSDSLQVKEAAENFVLITKNAHEEMSESGDFSSDALASLGIDF